MVVAVPLERGAHMEGVVRLALGAPMEEAGHLAEAEDPLAPAPMAEASGAPTEEAAPMVGAPLEVAVPLVGAAVRAVGATGGLVGEAVVTSEGAVCPAAAAMAVQTSQETLQPGDVQAIDCAGTCGAAPKSPV